MTYSSAVRRDLIYGLTDYNILRNPKYKEAFAISDKFAFCHRRLKSIRNRRSDLSEPMSRESLAAKHLAPSEIMLLHAENSLLRTNPIKGKRNRPRAPSELTDDDKSQGRPSSIRSRVRGTSDYADDASWPSWDMRGSPAPSDQTEEEMNLGMKRLPLDEEVKDERRLSGRSVGHIHTLEVAIPAASGATTRLGSDKEVSVPNQASDIPDLSPKSRSGGMLENLMNSLSPSGALRRGSSSGSELDQFPSKKPTKSLSIFSKVSRGDPVPTEPKKNKINLSPFRSILNQTNSK